MNINELITFKRAAELLNFSNTAKELNYSQSAITIQIKNLEEEFGVQLFDRVGKNVKLTPAGHALLNHANTIINEVERAKNEIGKDNLSQDFLRVGCIDSICSCHIPKIIKILREKQTTFPLKIVTSSPSDLLDMMNKNQLDLVYILDRPIFNSKWEKAIDIVEPLNFISSSTSEFANKEDLSIYDIINENFYLTEDNVNYRLSLEERLAELDLEIRPRLEVSSPDIIIKALLESKAISYLPNFSFKEDLEEGLVSILPIKEINLTMNRQLFYHKDKFVTKEMETFIKVVSEDLK